MPPRGDGWLHEIKIDGFRVQLHKQAGRATIYGVDGRELTGYLPQLRQNLLTLPVRSLIIDALVVVREGNVKLGFDAFLARAHTRCCCWCFDLLEYEGVDMRPKTLIERKARLEPHVRDDHLFRYCNEITNPDKALAVSERIGFRGVVSKRADQPYKSGRNPGWIEVASAAATPRPPDQQFSPKPRMLSARRPAPRRSVP